MSTQPPPVRPREIFGWAMFDFANSSYTTVVVTVAYSVYFTRVVAPGAKADFLWGLGVMISNLLVVVASPLVGAIADDSGRKKQFLFASYLACVAGTAALWFVTPGLVALGLALFIVGNMAFSFGENFAGAFLPEISTPATIGRISGLGWGLGYFGGLASLLAVFPLISSGFTPENVPRLRLAWLITAGFFLLAGIPTFLLLRERAPRGPSRSLADHAANGFRRLAATFGALGHFRVLARFLAVFFVFNAGLAAVINFSAIYAERTLGFSAGDLIALFIALQVSSALGALGFGYLQDRLGARRTVLLTLALWIGVCVAAYAVQTKGAFIGVGMAAGIGIGSLQSACRAMVGLFSPLDKVGEFYGFWGLAGKGAFVVGPFAFGALSSATGSQRLAILATGLFFLAGFAGMLTVDEAKGRAAAAAWRG